MLKKTWRFLTSMKFAILLLAVLTLACVFGSVIPQGGTLDEYLGAYGERGGALIVGLCLDDVFHSTWFLVLTVLLVCDLLYCNLIRLPSLLSRMKRFRDPQTAWRLSEAAQAFDEAETPAGEEAEPKPARRRQEPAVCTVKQVPDAAAVFETLHMKPVPGERAGRKTLFAAQNSVGLWGAWVTHLGILLLIVGFTLGQTTRQLYTVHGVPGQTLPVGDTGCTLTINDFDVSLTDSGVASQFTSDVTMRDPGGATESAVVSVNRPGDLFGYKVFQNSTGTAAKVTVTKDGAVVQEEVLCAGDYIYVLDTPMALFFNGYYRDALDFGGMKADAFAWSTYYNGVYSETRYQAEGETAISTDSIRVVFSEPQSYTLLQLKRERFIWLVLLGGLVTLAGLVLSFYLQPRRLWAEQTEAGWTVHGESRKGGALFRDRLREAAGENGQQPGAAR